MNCTIIAAIITGGCAIIAAIIGLFAIRKKHTSEHIRQQSKGNNNIIIGKQDIHK